MYRANMAENYIYNSAAYIDMTISKQHWYSIIYSLFYHTIIYTLRITPGQQFGKYNQFISYTDKPPSQKHTRVWSLKREYLNSKSVTLYPSYIYIYWPQRILQAANEVEKRTHSWKTITLPDKNFGNMVHVKNKICKILF